MNVIGQLLTAAEAVLADYDERMRLYPGVTQPHRVRVMTDLRTAVEQVRNIPDPLTDYAGTADAPLALLKNLAEQLKTSSPEKVARALIKNQRQLRQAVRDNTPRPWWKFWSR